MDYKLFTFCGITIPDGDVIALSLKDVIKDYSDMFSSVEATCEELYDSKAFCLKADVYNMPQMIEKINDGCVIIPFSRTIYIIDLLNYYNLKLTPVFMKIKDYKQFKIDYENSLVKIEDNRTKELF